MPKKLDSCVKKVIKSNKKKYGYEKYNPWAVCKTSLKLNGRGKKNA